MFRFGLAEHAAQLFDFGAQFLNLGAIALDVGEFFRDVIGEALGGVDVVYDPVGGPGFTAALSACRPEGRLLTIGFASGEVPPIPANLLLVKNLSVIGLSGGGSLSFAPQILTASLRTLFQWFAEGGLRPHISHELPFDAYPDGLNLLKTRQATGKIVITL